MSTTNHHNERARLAIDRAANAAQAALPLAQYLERTTEANLADIRQLIGSLDVLATSLGELRTLTQPTVRQR